MPAPEWVPSRLFHLVAVLLPPIRSWLLYVALQIGMLCCPGTAVAGDQVPSRVVSLNLCTDELLLMLAQPGQIASLTWLVKDPTLSWLAAQAQPYPSNRGLAEEILVLDPDLVLAGEFTTPTTVALLRELGVPLLQLRMPSNLPEVEAQIERVAVALGRARYGLQVVDEMRTRLAALPPLPSGGAALTAALFQPNGLTATEDTLVHSALHEAGLLNLAVVRDMPNYARLPLELLLHDQPDLLVLNTYEQRMPSLAQALMEHPVLHKSFGAQRQVVVPAQAWSCGTPHYVQAVEILRHAAIEYMKHRALTG